MLINNKKESKALGNRISIGSDIVTKVGEQVEVVCNSENYYRYGSRYNTGKSKKKHKNSYFYKNISSYNTYSLVMKKCLGNDYC